MTREELIKQELTADPLGVGYSTMTDQQVADSLNAKTRVRQQPIPTYLIKRYMVLNDLWLPIKQSTAPEAQVTIDALATFEHFDVVDPTVATKFTAILDGLIAQGLLTTAQKAEILNLQNEPISRAEEIGVTPPVTAVDVTRARRI